MKKPDPNSKAQKGYDFVVERGKATASEIAKHLGIERKNVMGTMSGRVGHGLLKMQKVPMADGRIEDEYSVPEATAPLTDGFRPLQPKSPFGANANGCIVRENKSSHVQPKVVSTRVMPPEESRNDTSPSNDVEKTEATGEDTLFGAVAKGKEEAAFLRSESQPATGGTANIQSSIVEMLGGVVFPHGVEPAVSHTIVAPFVEGEGTRPAPRFLIADDGALTIDLGDDVVQLTPADTLRMIRFVGRFEVVAE